jgi:hypothetical protein
MAKSKAYQAAADGHCHGNRVWQVGPRRARLAA